MSKLCLIYNTAPRYREAIFRAIDAEYDCEWFFGESKSDIKQMDISLLRNTHCYKVLGFSKKFYIKKGLIKQLFKRKFQTFFMLPETRSFTDWLFLWLAFTFFPKKKIYIWTHGWYGKESPREAKMKLWMYRHVTGLFVYGNYARELLIKEGILAEKIFVIRNSLHYGLQKSLREKNQLSSIYSNHFGNNNPTIIFIGRLTKVKNLDMLVNAIADLKSRGENYNLVFIGDGTEKISLEAIVKTRGIADRVWFYGASYDEKRNAELIYNADLCVAPGNVGLTAMHTMVFGCPVISHNEFKWQMPEFEAIRPGETGVFFDYQNESSLVETISKWFTAKVNKRDEVRKACYNEIDTQWNPYFQMDVIKKNLKLK